MVQVDPPTVLMVAELSMTFSRGVFHGVVTYVRQNTNWRLACQAHFDLSEARHLSAAGVISLSADNDVVDFARRSNLPLVLVGNTRFEPWASSVFVDEQQIGEMAAEYLAGLGLRHFACIGHGPWAFMAQRLGGFVAAVESRGLGPVHQLVGTLYDGRRRTRFRRDIASMLESLPRPCGLLAANDTLGVEIIAACGNIGLRVPDDIAVLGVDDDEVACELSNVPLSSVAQPLTAIGYESARMLHRHLDGRQPSPAQLTLPPMRVAARSSTDLVAIDDADVAAAVRLINLHFAEPIGVAWIVRQLPVARRSLERKFKAMVGRTILEQIHHVRFAKAKELLAESDLAFEVVAQRSGFANARWLADSFRRELHTTPMRYRRQFRTEA